MALFISTLLISLLSLSEEQVFLKQRTTKPIVAGGFVGQTTEEKDLMPGNDKLGFFYKAETPKKGICRLRVKVVCDYGLENLKDLKNQDVVIQVHNTLFKSVVGHDGILDMLFKCDSVWQEEDASLRTGKFEAVFKLKESQGTYRIPDKQCKL